MLRARLWGRPAWSWAVDAVLVAVVVFLLTTSDDPTVRTLALVLLGWRAITVAAGLLAVRLRSRGARRG